MANNEITGPGQAAQVTVVGGGQQYRPSVNYSMPVMQPRQRFQMPDIDVGSSINIDLSPIADAMIKSSELKAKKAEKESEDALANIYNSYARDVNEISNEFEQGYASMEQAQARFRKLNDNVLRVPGIDASKITTLGSKLNGYSEDLMKTQATERIKDKQDFLYKRIEEYQKMPQFSGYSFDEIEAMIVHDNLQNVMLTNINEQLKTVTTPEEKRALESQKIALMTGNAESMALLKLQDIVKNYDGAELNEQTYQSIQAELIGFLSQQFDFQRSSQIAYSAMKKFHMGNLHTMKKMSVESRDKIAKEIETVTKNKLTAAEGELIDNLPQASILSIAKASLAKKVLPDAAFNFQNSLELQGVMKDIMSIGKNTEGQLVMPAKGSLGGISTATINTMSRILQDPSTEKYTIGPTAIYLGNLSGAVRDKVVENISKDPEGTVATAKEYKEVFGKKIPVVKARLEKESKESEQNLIWDFSNRKQFTDDLEICNKEINACYYAAKGGAKEYSKRTASADLLKGVLSTNALRFDERTGTIGMVDISDYVLPPLKDEASFKDWLARNVLERGAKWMMELGQVFTGNEVQENVDSLNDWLRTVPPEYRHAAVNVLFNQEIPVAGTGEKIKSTGNWASSTVEFLSGMTKGVVNSMTEPVLNEYGYTPYEWNKLKYASRTGKQMLENQREQARIEQAGKDFIEGISTANERSRTLIEGIGDVAGELFGFRDAHGAENTSKETELTEIKKHLESDEGGGKEANKRTLEHTNILLNAIPLENKIFIPKEGELPPEFEIKAVTSEGKENNTRIDSYDALTGSLKENKNLKIDKESGYVVNNKGKIVGIPYVKGGIFDAVPWVASGGDLKLQQLVKREQANMGIDANEYTAEKIKLKVDEMMENIKNIDKLITPEIIKKMIARESSYEIYKTATVRDKTTDNNPKTAFGLMQIRDSQSWIDYNNHLKKSGQKVLPLLDILRPETNIEAGIYFVDKAVKDIREALTKPSKYVTLNKYMSTQKNKEEAILRLALNVYNNGMAGITNPNDTPKGSTKTYWEILKASSYANKVLGENLDAFK